MNAELDRASYASSPYFAVSLPKLALMSVCTFGIYEFYWFYKHWRAVRDRAGEDLWPFWRALFMWFTCYFLFKRIKTTASAEAVPSRYSAGGAALIYVLLAIKTQGLGTWDVVIFYVSFFSFVPLIFVQRAVNDLNQRVVPEANRNARFSLLNIIAILIGGSLLLATFSLPGNGIDREILEALPTEERTLQVGSEMKGELTPGDRLLPDETYAQAWALKGQAGESVVVDLLSDAFNAYLFVVGPGFAKELKDDDGGGGLNSRITFVIPEDGTYQVVVNTYEAQKIGPFILRVTEQK